VNQVPPRRSSPIAAAVAALLALGGCGGAEAPPQPPAAAFAAAAKVQCSEQAYSVAADPASSWAHPQQNYYAPGAPAPSESDLQHLLVNDAAVVVRYHPRAPVAARAALRDWAKKLSSVVVLSGRSADAAAVEAFTGNRHLICDGADPAQLTVFADRRGSLEIAPHPGTG
jgi:hypothetical protein